MPAHREQTKDARQESRNLYPTTQPLFILRPVGCFVFGELSNTSEKLYSGRVCMSNNQNFCHPQRLSTFSLTAYPWVVMLACSLFLVYKYILQVSPSVMTPELMGTFHVDGAGLGNLAATFFYAYVIAQFFVGPLLDRTSPRTLTTLAILLCAGGIALFGNARSLWVAEISRALMGIGVAFATINYMKMGALWIEARQYPLVGGLLVTAAMVGALFGQTPLAILVHHVGWRESLQYCAYLGLIIALLFWLVTWRCSAQTQLIATQTFKPHWRDIARVFASKRNWLLTVYSGLALSPIAVLGGLWGNPFLCDVYHISRTSAATFISLSFIGLAVGAPIFGWLSARTGNRVLVMAIGTLLSCIMLLITLYSPQLSYVHLSVVLFLFGFGTGSFMLAYTIGKESNSLAVAATVMAMINSGDGILGAISEPVIGKLLDFFSHNQIINGINHFSIESFHYALALLPMYLVLALLCLLWLRKFESKWLSPKKD